MAAANCYETTTVTGHATAVLGNKYGDVFNIQQATFLLSTTSVPNPIGGSKRIVRQNRVLPGEEQTVEIITTYNDGSLLTERGTSEKVELVWTRCEDLGVGVFGEVHREMVNVDGVDKNRAVKVLRRKQLEHMRIDYKKELDALIQLSQPAYVHRFVEFSSWYENRDKICLAMEFVQHGDLEKFIQQGLSEDDTRQIAYQVLDGLSVMHRLDLVHRDIKPANIFVVQEQPTWWVKIGDFSICKSTITRQTSLRTQVGTQGYQAPEILGLIPTRKAEMYDSKCDIWSFGCLVFELLTKMVPFENVGLLTSYCQEHIRFPGLEIKKAGASWLIAEFVWFMLQADPECRPNTEQALFLLSYRCKAGLNIDQGYIPLEDGLGRVFCLPRGYCSTWAAIQSTARSIASYLQQDGIGNLVQQDKFCFRTESQQVFDASNWHQLTTSNNHLLLDVSSTYGDQQTKPSQSWSEVDITTTSDTAIYSTAAQEPLFETI